jgi:hypothetical protein
MSTIRRSARLAAKATNATQPAVVVVAVSQPTAPAVVVNQPCNCPPSKKETVIRTIQKYLLSVDQACGILKIQQVIELFEFIDKNFEFINSVEFHETKRFVLTVHNKTIELERDLLRQLEERGGYNCKDYESYYKAVGLVRRIHTKCHLYGMDNFVTADPVYKKFLDTYIEKYLSNQ